MSTFFEARGATISWPSGARALDAVSLEVRKGELVALIGPNGSGKSTLLRALAGLLSPTIGEALLESRVVSDLPRDEAARRVAFVPQSSSLPFDYTVLEVVLMGRHPFGRGLVLERASDVVSAERALQRAGAAEFRDRLYTELSGGERQRVVIARALAQGTPGLLLDEPTSAQDMEHALRLFELMAELAHQDGRAVVLATHDLNAAARFADRIVVLAKGKVVRQGGPREVLDASVLREVFAVEVLLGTTSSGAPYAIPTAPSSKGGPA